MNSQEGLVSNGLFLTKYISEHRIPERFWRCQYYFELMTKSNIFVDEIFIIDKYVRKSPSMDPCGTPFSILKKSLLTSCILTRCWRVAHTPKSFPEFYRDRSNDISVVKEILHFIILNNIAWQLCPLLNPDKKMRICFQIKWQQYAYRPFLYLK